MINANFITGLNQPFGLALSGNTLFVANNTSNTVGEYNATTGAAINANFITGSAITETLATLAVRAQEVGVIDAERIIPGWKADGSPFVLREHFSRDEFAPEVVDRLEYLCETEGGPEKLVPLVVLWKGLRE